MPEVHFEIIRLEDIGKDILKSSSKKSTSRSAHKLTDADVQNLKHYLHRYNQPSAKTTTTTTTTAPTANRRKSVDDMAASQHRDHVKVIDSAHADDLSEYSQPLTDIYRYHHHYRRHHQQTRHAHDKPTALPVSVDGYEVFCLDFATCGMKKNTRLPVPHVNFSLLNGCFGDDAGFTTQRQQQNFLGISDGAGGNLMYGFDPRLFSESLMRNCSNLAHTGKYPTHEPKRLLCHAFDRVQTENCFGSATACVVGVDCHTGQLHSVNIGDSGYVVVRDGRVVFRSRSQKMNGDCPRQLDVYPWTAALKSKGLNYTQISSLDAICQTFQLELDDVLILSTDGLFDNVPDRLIEKILASNATLKQAANHLVNHAIRFYVKPDDILIIMARLTTKKSDAAHAEE